MIRFVFIGLVLCVPALAQINPGGQKPEVITRVYDVSDFLIDVRDHPNESSIVPPTKIGGSRAARHNGGGGGGGGGLFGGGGGVSEQKPVTPASRLDELIKLISETVDPASWRSAGGAVGSIRGLSGHVIVTQTAENHNQISNLFSQLRETRARMVRVRATWVSLTEEQLKAASKGDKAAVLQEIDLASVEKIADAVKHRAQTTCFNRQRVHIASGRAKSVLTDITAVVGTQTAAFEPTIELVQAGATLEFVATLAADDSAVTLDIESVVSRWDKPDAPLEIPRPHGPATQPSGRDVEGLSGIKLDRLNMPTQSLATTVQIPMNKAIVIGGMTLEPETDAGKQLYLIIEAAGGTAKGK